MRIVRDGAKFSVIGAVQVAVDSVSYIALTTLGIATPPANVCGRIVGALLGFWLNGRVTFVHREQPRLRWRLARYVALWVVLTIVSTVSLTVIGHHAGTSLLVVRFALNQAREIALAKQRFQQNGVEVKGAIFNAVERRATGYYSYGYYDYKSAK